MTRLLSIDASTWFGGVALLDDLDGAPRLVAEIGFQAEDSLAARLLPMAETLLATVGWPRSTLSAYAAIRGPGSFTGVRVALGLASGLALAAGRPFVGVDSLTAMAEAHGPEAAFRVPLLDAGRGEVYGARFDPESSPPRVIRPAWVGPAQLAIEPGVKAVIFGGAALRYETTLRDAGYDRTPSRAPASIAAAAGRIALMRLAAGTADSADRTPLYVRPADAEVKLR